MPFAMPCGEGGFDPPLRHADRCNAMLCVVMRPFDVVREGGYANPLRHAVRWRSAQASPAMMRWRGARQRKQCVRAYPAVATRRDGNETRRYDMPRCVLNEMHGVGAVREPPSKNGGDRATRDAMCRNVPQCATSRATRWVVRYQRWRRWRCSLCPSSRASRWLAPTGAGVDSRCFSLYRFCGSVVLRFRGSAVPWFWPTPASPAGRRSASCRPRGGTSG